MRMTEYILGFTARPFPRRPSHEWPPARRRGYLLVEDVADPITVDSTGSLQLPAMTGRCAEVFGRSRLDTSLKEQKGASPSEYPCVRLWPSLPVLQEFLAAEMGHLASGRYCMMAIARLSDRPISRSFTNGFGRCSETVDVLTQEWLKVGYDVADVWMLSGLMNCGYSEEARRACSTFISRLNQHHLFVDSDGALDFALRANSRVSEHAPFFVYSIYLNVPNTDMGHSR